MEVECADEMRCKVSLLFYLNIQLGVEVGSEWRVYSLYLIIFSGEVSVFLT